MQCDVKTVTSWGHIAMTSVTAITTQGRSGVTRCSLVESDLIEAQLNTTFEDFEIDAVKTGMLGNSACVKSVAKILAKFHSRKPFVLDPVHLSTSGSVLLEDNALTLMANQLMPLATVVTPNVQEAATLAKRNVTSLEDIKLAGYTLLDLGAEFVLITGGHFTPSLGTDFLFGPRDRPKMKEFPASYFARECEVHGTGCALSTAIACGLANGKEPAEAIVDAKRYVEQAIAGRLELAPNYWALDHQPFPLGSL